MPEAARVEALAPRPRAIRAAHDRIRPHVHRTPVFTCAAVDAEVGARLWFKAESLQKIGAFKARGASNAVFSLSDDVARRGVVTHSSGNHGAAIAYAAGRRGIPAWVVMPENSAKVKQENVRRFGRDHYVPQCRCARQPPVPRSRPRRARHSSIRSTTRRSSRVRGRRRWSSSRRCRISTS
jgi:threonine dehydratase